MNHTRIPADGIVVTTTTVREEWLDYNQHMNVACYVLVFDLGIDDIKTIFGLNAKSREMQQRSTVALEAHVTYQREALRGEKLRVESRILACDGKRLHYAQEMYRGSELLATQEMLSISFNLATRRTCPFEPAVMARIRQLETAQARLPRPTWAGRTIGLGGKRPA